MGRSRKERMQRMNGEIIEYFEKTDVISMDFLTARYMYLFGISKRDAREEISAVVTLVGAEIEEGKIRNKKIKQEKLEE